MNARFPLVAAVLLALVGPAAATAQEPGGPPQGPGAVGRGSLRGYANPSAAIAAELALDRDAAARGQNVALAAAAAPDALVFTPRLAWAREWLKGRGNPPRPAREQVAAVWASCDGSLILARGPVTFPGGGPGWYARLWQRQPDGRYQWLVGLSGPAAGLAPDPEMIAAQVADCPPRPARLDDDEPRGGGKGSEADKPLKHKDQPPLDPLRRTGAAPDGSLRWEASVAADGTRRLVVGWRKNGAEQALLDERVAPAD